MRIDVNADLGEGFGAWSMGDDARMLDIVTSANVACGFHAGDPAVMLETCRLAADRGVAVGAHVSYRDLAGFGRTPMDVPAARLRADVVYQIGALLGVAKTVGAEVSFVKPHGALYNRIARDPVQARAVVDAVAAVNNVLAEPLALVGMPESVVLELAQDAEIPVVREAFADRAYRADGSLVPRTEEGAVLTDLDVIADRVVQVASEGTVITHDGTEIELQADTICVHGDTPGAVRVAETVRQALEAAGIDVAACAS